jgi:hypothetical protein
MQSPFVTVKVSLDEQGMTEFLAYQMSRQCKANICISKKDILKHLLNLLLLFFCRFGISSRGCLAIRSK